MTDAWHLTRSSTTAVTASVANGAAAAFPASFFSATAFSSGVTVTTLGTGVITIATAGYYELACSVVAQPPTPSLALGPEGQIGFNWAYSINGGQASGAILYGAKAIVHLNAGDTVQPMLAAVGDGQTMENNQSTNNANAGVGYATIATNSIRGFAHFSGRFVRA